MKLPPQNQTKAHNTSKKKKRKRNPKHDREGAYNWLLSAYSFQLLCSIANVAVEFESGSFHSCHEEISVACSTQQTERMCEVEKAQIKPNEHLLVHSPAGTWSEFS